MGFLGNLSKGISDFGQSTIQKGKDVANVAKLSRMISDEEKVLSKLFEQLGRKYFYLSGDEPAEELAEFIDEIKESQEKISGYQASVKELQGITKCEKCGADIPNGARFCPECGEEVIFEVVEEGGTDPANSVKRYCTDCGAVLVPGSRFCMSCGKKIETDVPVSEIVDIDESDE